ncbi:hypothetical protein K8I61_18485 [bacterium]|nr:hypothetical protein [bacterium]
MSWHNEFRYLFALQTILHKPRRPGDGFPEDINGKRFVIDGNVLRNKGLPYGGIVCVQEIRNEYIAMPVLSAKSYEGDWLGISQIADLLSLGFIVGVDVVIPGDDHFPRERQKEIK